MTCSATGGPSAAPPKPAPTPSSGTAGPTKATAATEIDPQARGVSWLRAEDGIPQRVKSAYLSDEDIIALADHAAQTSASRPAT